MINSWPSNYKLDNSLRLSWQLEIKRSRKGAHSEITHILAPIKTQWSSSQTEAKPGSVWTCSCMTMMQRERVTVRTFEAQLSDWDKTLPRKLLKSLARGTQWCACGKCCFAMQSSTSCRCLRGLRLSLACVFLQSPAVPVESCNATFIYTE